MLTRLGDPAGHVYDGTAPDVRSGALSISRPFIKWKGAARLLAQVRFEIMLTKMVPLSARLFAIVVASAVLLSACQAPHPSSWEEITARDLVRIAKTTDRLTGFKEVEVALQLPPGALTQGQYSELAVYNAGDPGRKIARVTIDNIAHGGADKEQDIQVYFGTGVCMTVDIMRAASGVEPEPFVDLRPPQHGAYQSGHRSPLVHTFHIKDIRDADSSVIYLGYQRGQCFDVVMQKYRKPAWI